MPAFTRFDHAPHASALRRIGLALLVLFAAMPLAAAGANGKPASGKAAVEHRCGWFVNPSPANAWLIDRDGEWVVAMQGGHQADGDWPPPIAEKEWVQYGGNSYGYGCACMKVRTDRKHMRIERIVSSQGKTLAQCRRDRALTEPSL
ncbi:DUF4087 domain-containing protein [Lysobacter sp. CA199]|uniref:DUF4087 domain-containing protein n=1 Tax=Lysobacter sp. CA199 TaxID=3455608 RepID=UPI003F8D3F12